MLLQYHKVKYAMLDKGDQQMDLTALIVMIMKELRMVTLDVHPMNVEIMLLYKLMGHVKCARVQLYLMLILEGHV